MGIVNAKWVGVLLVVGAALTGVFYFHTTQATKGAASVADAPTDSPSAATAAEIDTMVRQERRAANPMPDPVASATVASVPVKAFDPSLVPDASFAAAAERDEQIAALRASGPPSRELSRRAQPVSNVLQKLAAASSTGNPPAGFRKAGDAECHRAGCFLTLTQPSEDALSDLTARVLASEEMLEWPGASIRSAPIWGPNGVEATWFLAAAPDAGM